MEAASALSPMACSNSEAQSGLDKYSSPMQSRRTSADIRVAGGSGDSAVRALTLVGGAGLREFDIQYMPEFLAEHPDLLKVAGDSGSSR